MVLKKWWGRIGCGLSSCGILVASFPGPARSSLAVRNSRRGPGLVHHVMCAAALQYRSAFQSSNLIGWVRGY